MTKQPNRRFASAMMQRVYDRFVGSPPPERADGSLGGDSQTSSFRAGMCGTKGIHFGVSTSLCRAAWWAGHDVAATERKGNSK